MSVAVRAVKTSLQKNISMCRTVSTSASCYGKRNFRKFLIYNKRGTRAFKQQQMEKPDPNIPIDTRGVRPTGYTIGRKFIEVQEMIPELVVPNLENFKLKPYVSYRAPDVVQSEFTAKDLFDAVYSRKIVEDFKAGKLDSKGDPLEPSEQERLTADKARKNALQTGGDIF